MLGLFGWGRRIRKLRKRWDRLREKALKKKGLLRKAALERLDNIENNLRTLEETRLTRIERVRIAKDVEISLEEMKEFLKARPDQLQEYSKQGKRLQL